MAKIRHLQRIHDLKSYRNACKVIQSLQPYVNETYFNKEKVIFLNKDGRELIGSSKEVKRNSVMEHTLLSNEAYMYLNCPIDWKREHVIEIVEKPKSNFELQFSGGPQVKKRIICDAKFTRNGYTHLVEIDNKRGMQDNKKKIEMYAQLFPLLTLPNLNIFTNTENRKKKFQEWIKEKKIRGVVKTFDEIRESEHL